MLLKVYDTAVQEYRFNVQLAWDRAKFYLTLSLTAIAAGVGLFKVSEGSALTSLFLAAYFVALIVVTWLGGDSVRKGKDYYRESILTKTLVERELGLLEKLRGFDDPRMHLSLTVTPGMQRFKEILFRHREKLTRKPAAGSITDRLTLVFWALIVIEALGVLLSVSNVGNQLSATMVAR